jgi:hypothetical protein
MAAREISLLPPGIEDLLDRMAPRALQTVLPYINPRSDGAPEILRVAIAFARREQDMVVLTREALIRATLVVGWQAGNDPANWLCAIIDRVEPGYRDRTERSQTLLINSASETERLLEAGAKIVLSSDLLTRVLPRARDLAKQASGQTGFSQRHLIASLLYEGNIAWALGEEPIDALAFSKIQGNFLRIAAERRGDDPQSWLKSEALSGFAKVPGVKQLEPAPSPTARPQPKKRRPRATPSSPPAKPQSQRLAIQTDRPAIVDKLDRKPFAQVLADRIVEARALQNESREPGDAAFMVHLDGPWGSGKSSVLQFLRDDLEKRKDEHGKPAPWLVVSFNAWAFQRLRPPWWSLTNQIYREALRDAPWFGKAVLWAKWQWLRFRADVMTALVFFALVGVAGLFVYLAITGDPSPPKGSAPSGGKSQIEIIAAIVAASAALYPLSRSLLFGSNSAAQHYAELRSDPYGPIIRLFESLVRHIGKPIIVFIDDLDRCDKDYVTELLESIQTMMRGAAITYLVAGDRKWICRSFGERYKDFAAEHDDPGRPLGYNFLDKVFQLSASLPRLPQRLRDSYWRDLLDEEDREQHGAADAEKIAQVKAAVDEKIAANAPSEEIQASLAPLRNDASPEAAAILTKAARHRATPEAKEKTLHRLGPLADLIEANPRAMKRLVNAVGVAESRLYLERRPFEVEALARWTILELRWPLLAEWLAEEPKRLTAKANDTPSPLEVLGDTPAVRHVIGKPGAVGRLTVEAVQGLVA